MQVNTEKTELALKTASSEINIFVTDAAKEVQALEDKYANLVPDASTKEGYADCKKVRRDLMPIKSGLEGARKTLKAPILEAGRLVDNTLNPLSTRVENLYKPFEAAYRAVDEEKKMREQRRQETIQEGFSKLDAALMSASGTTSTVIETIMEEVADFSIDRDVFMEKSDEAAKRHSEVMEKLGEMLLQATQIEEMQAKQAEIEAREKAIAEKEAAEAKAREEEQRKIAQAQREAEMQKAREEARKQAEADAEARHKKEMEEAEQRAKDAAENARLEEQKRAEAAAAKAKAEAEAREADIKHKSAVHNAILEAILVTGITEEQAKEVIKLAARHNAGSMYIQY